mgnify:FL=1
MSDIKKEAILTLKIDEGTFNQDILKTTRNIEELKKERELYSKKQEYGIKLTEEEVLADKKLEAQIKANQTALRSLQKITQLQTEANLAQKGSVDQLSKQYKAAELELKRLGGTVERGADGQLRLTGAYKENEVAANQVFQTLKEYDALLGKHNLNVGNYGSVLTKLKQQISELDQQRSIATDPEEVMRLTTEIRNLTLQQDQYLGKVDELGNRVARNDIKDGFQDANGAVGALSSGLFLLTLGMDENSKAGEIMRKVMIGVTIAQTALSIAQSKADIAGTAALIKTKLLTAAQWAYNNAVSAFTAVGAIALVAALVKIASSTKNQNKEANKAYEIEKKWADLKQDNIKKELAKQEQLFEVFSNAEKKRNDILLQESLGNEQSKEKIALLQEEINSYKAAIDANQKKAIANKQFGAFEKVYNSETIEALKALVFARQLELNQINTKATTLDANDKKDFERLELLKRQVTEVNLLTTAERVRFDQQIKQTFLDNPNVQDAFQKLIGVDASTFNEIWASVGQNIDNTKQGIVGVEKAQENLNKTTKDYNEDLEDQKRILAEREAAIYHLGSVMSNVFQGAFADADDAQKQFFKNAVIGLLDYLQKFIMEKKIEAVVSQLASKGFLGVITGAAIVGLIDGAFAVAKSQITGYAEGGLVLPEHGIPIQRDNGDNRLATIKTGEVIMNDTHQSRLKQVAGVDIFKKLGIPGFANGGVMDGGFAYRSATSKVNDGIEIRQVVYEAVRNMPPQVLYISDLERMQNSRDKAVNVMSINK